VPESPESPELSSARCLATAGCLTPAQLAALLQEAEPIESDGYGLKVARLVNGDFIKLYRRKRFFSRALWSPPARRFTEHAARLRALGFIAPQVIGWWQISGQKLTAVRYRPLPGATLRQRWPGLTRAERAQEIQQFGALLGRLHQLGVYFRSVHLGNIVRLPDGALGLIDLSDMRLGKGPLSARLRQRNLRHILRYREDAVWLLEHHRAAWLQGYEQSAGACVQVLAQALAKHDGV